MDVYSILNGRPSPITEAKVSVLDRGFMFGDGAYEVVRIYSGRPFLLDEHLDRFRRSLDGLRIAGVDIPRLRATLLSAVHAAALQEATLYWQVTRGAPITRSHAFPADGTPLANPYEDTFPPASVRPTEFLYVMPYEDTNAEKRRSGCRAIRHPDLRWARCDLKSLNLLGNVFAAQAAKEAGAFEALLVKPDGELTEGSHTSVWAVVEGKLRLPPLSPAVLPGITREVVAQIVRELGLPLEERAVSGAELERVTEIFLTGTTTEVLPVTRLDGCSVGTGAPGPFTRKLQSAFEILVRRFRESTAPVPKTESPTLHNQ